MLSGFVLLLLGIVPLAGPMLVPSAAVAAPAPTPTPSVTGPAVSPGVPRYYVVGQPQNGVREYLYQIAAQTLGDGNRFRELFDLNRDRRQPDGGQLADPLSALQPGWILQLPPDASGPGVSIGPLPSQSPAEPDRSADDSGAGSTGGGATPYLIGAAGLLVMALVIALVLRLLRGGRRSRNTAAPVDGAGRATPVEREPVVPAGTAVEPAARPAHPAPAASAPAASAPAASAPDAPASGAAEPAPSSPAESDPVTPGRPTLDTSGRVVVDLRPLAGDLPDRLNVRLLGMNSETSGTPYAWLGDEPLPAATMPVVLGRQDEWRFFVDLGAAPGIFTVTGTPTAARREALAFAEQLSKAGVVVTVVGDALGADLPSGYRRLEAYPVDDHDIALLGAPGVLFSGGLRGAELAAARGLAARTRHQVVPVLVGEVLRGRWSMLVTE
ncbi:hypothetical protein AB0J84_08305 [Micromonospora arborensis]|uniref:LysM peptidoglycan-binding domain-containing protein n=1 Tax=Micromonospora arborensis TaxID=2116518 RepID=UPI003424459A